MDKVRFKLGTSKVYEIPIRNRNYDKVIKLVEKGTLFFYNFSYFICKAFYKYFLYVRQFINTFHKQLIYTKVNNSH